jgi:hypothetical protein
VISGTGAEELVDALVGDAEQGSDVASGEPDLGEAVNGSGGLLPSLGLGLCQ